MLKEYTDYFKDNPKGLWFKRKLFGWGWTPVKWQGWLVTLAFVGFIIWTGTRLSPTATTNELDWFFAKIAVAIFLLMFIAYKKGEKPRWQWGVPKKNTTSNKSNEADKNI